MLDTGEGRVSVWTPIQWLRAGTCLTELMEGLEHRGHLGKKTVVKIYESQEMVELFDVGGAGKFLDCSNLGGQGYAALGVDKMPQEG